MTRLAGKVAVITAGSTGIGLATAKRFAAEGAHVYSMGRRQSELDVAVRQMGKHVTGVQGDVVCLADLDCLYALVKQHHGHIDVIFANAVGEVSAPLGEIIGEITEAQVDTIFSINVKCDQLHRKFNCYMIKYHLLP